MSNFNVFKYFTCDDKHGRHDPRDTRLWKRCPDHGIYKRFIPNQPEYKHRFKVKHKYHRIPINMMTGEWMCGSWTAFIVYNHQKKMGWAVPMFVDLRFSNEQDAFLFQMASEDELERVPHEKLLWVFP